MPGLSPILLLSPGGMLGRAFEALLRRRGLSFTTVSRPEVDLGRPETLAAAFAGRPRMVINCSAFTDVDGAETREEEAGIVNGSAVAELALLCRQHGSLLVHFSTDYVFDGKASTPYPVDHPIAPVNAYGRSKAAGEAAIRASGCEHLLVRTSWLYAPWGRNFVLTMIGLGREKESIRVVEDQVGRPTSCEYLAERTLALAEAGARGTFHVTDGGSCSWYELAAAVLAATGSKCRVEPCATSAFPRPAVRPPYSVLDLSKTEALLGPSRPWQQNLADVLAALAPAEAPPAAGPTTASPSDGTGRPPRARWLRWAPPAAVFLLAFAWYQAFRDYGFQPGDEGTLLLQFWRFASGETPYRDFNVGYTPGTYLIHKTLMQWFGAGVLPGRHLLAALHAGTATLLFLLTRRITGSGKWALLPPLLFLSAAPVLAGEYAAFNIPYPSWYCLFLFSTGALLLPRLVRNRSLAGMVGAGAMAGLTFAFKPNVGLFQLAASAFLALHALGRPSSRIDRLLWWTWWASILLGLLFLLSSVRASSELLGLLAPATIAALAIARDGMRRQAPAAAPSVAATALAMGSGFLVVNIPWMAWAWSIVGPTWFARRVFFVGTGLESTYYIPGPQLPAALVATLAGALLWSLPSLLARHGRRAWMLPPAGAFVAALAFLALVATRPMPGGLYAALMSAVEPKAFAATLFVQLAMLGPWLLARDRKEQQPGEPVVVTAVCGTMLYLQVFPRTDLWHWMGSAPLLFPSAAWLLQGLALRWSGGQRLPRRIVGAAFALPFVAIAVLRLGHFLGARWQVEDGRLARIPETVLRIEGEPLRINAGRADRFRDLEATVDYIHAHADPGQAVLTFPALDHVSYFSRTTPGNRHGYYFPGWPGHDAEAEVVSLLHARPPGLVVAMHERQLYFENAAAYYFLLADFVASHYRPAAQFGPYAVLSASPPSASDPRGEATPSTAVEAALPAGARSRMQDDLDSNDATRRLAAARRLAAWQASGDYEPLRRLVGDVDPAVRSAAVRAVPPTSSRLIRDALLQGAASGAFSTTDSVLAIRAANGACDEDCVAPLLELAWGFPGRTPPVAPEVALAARGVLDELPMRRWQSDFWWGRDEASRPPFPEPVRSRLRMELVEPEQQAPGSLTPEQRSVRSLAFAFADRLGLGECPAILRRWSGMRMEQVGFEANVWTAINHLSRASCEGPWLDVALHWMPLAPTLVPRIILREAPRDPAHADEALSVLASSDRGDVGNTALWLCSVAGAARCLEAAKEAMTPGASEERRAGAAWAWSRLAPDEASVVELQARAASDRSPQVQETARYGIATRTGIAGGALR